MKNLISLVETPISNTLRAVTFYQNILDIDIQEVDINGTVVWFFVHENEEQTVCLIKDENTHPSSDGTIAYFNADGKIDDILTKVEANGGQIVTPKIEIGSEMGSFAHFLDSEGNKIGLYSQI